MSDSTSPKFEAARAYFNSGVAHVVSEHWAEAESDFRSSLALLPDRVSTLTNLAATLIKIGQLDDASSVISDALFEPDRFFETGR